MLLNWLKGGYSLVTVAKHGHSFVLDVDDPVECERRGFKREWLVGCYAVDTPSGGEHHHGLHDATTERLGNLINVYRVKSDKNSEKILELKLNNQSVAAPTAKRIGQEKKCDGAYTPRVRGSKMKHGLHPDLLAWLKEHGEEPKPYDKSCATRVDFSSSVSGMGRVLLEQNDCTEDKSGTVDGVLHVVVESCPLCGKDARDSTVAAGVTKFIFGGNSYGFVCHHCGVDTRNEFVELMAESDSDFEPWQGYIYRNDDRKLIFCDPKFPVDDASESEAEAAATTEQAVPTASGPPDGEKEATEDFTFEEQDTGNGERLVKKFGHLIRWVSETNEWMVWDDKGWRKDNGGKLMRMTKAVLKDLVNEAYTGNKPDPQKLKHALVSGRLERRKAMIASAGYEHGVFTNINDWDADGWLFNCENGVIDLRTRTFRERTPSDLCMKQSPVRYDPDAKCPLWVAAMNKWMCGDQSLVEYLQVAWASPSPATPAFRHSFSTKGKAKTARTRLSASVATSWEATGRT